MKFLTTLPDARERAYGERVRVALKELFAVFHRREEMPERRWQQQLQAARDKVLQAGL